MNLQSQTDLLVSIVKGFNVPLATKLTEAIGAERNSHYYARQNLANELEGLRREKEEAGV